MSVSSFQYYLIGVDKQLGNRASLLKSWWQFCGPRGCFTRSIPAYLRYFKPGFHPSDDDDRALIARFERVLAGAPDLTV